MSTERSEVYARIRVLRLFVGIGAILGAVLFLTASAALTVQVYGFLRLWHACLSADLMIAAGIVTLACRGKDRPACAAMILFGLAAMYGAIGYLRLWFWPAWCLFSMMASIYFYNALKYGRE